MQPDQNLLHYRLVEKIGEGGMGVVWKALDTSLQREVAIKVLPEIFSRDPERLARFEREARLLASLNHPNIATVHGLHEVEGLRFLAMEMVEGEDLASRLERGPLAMEDVLAVASQIAGALEAAHSQGVIHRDLKPANVVLAPDGKAKVLDFGLAKTIGPDAASASGNLSLSPTATSMGTAVGMILGTAAYMSPEQARGRPVDRRTDLWSFGCLLYECLTGEPLFKGETISDSLAAILRKEPDWSAMPDDTPPLVRLLVRRCLSRDPRSRLQDAGDARIELEHAIEDPRGASLGFVSTGESLPAKSSKTAWVPWGVAAAALLFAAFFTMRGVTPTPDASAPRRLMIPVPGPTEFGDGLASPPAISPDGRTVVFGVADESGETSLWLRSLDDFDAHPLANTASAQYAFWSQDSRYIGFFSESKLVRIDVATGRVETIVDDGVTQPRGGSWSSTGRILYVPNSNSGIHVIDAAGGTARQITTPDPDVPDSSHRWPFFLPDGDHFLFVSWTNDLKARAEHGGVFVASLSGEEEPRRLVSDASSVAYTPPGYLLAVRGDNLVAIPFDAGERQVTGDSLVVAADMMRNRATAYSAFSASNEGTLVYASGQSFLPSTLVWYDRAGNATAAAGEPAPYLWLRLAPDTSRAAVAIPGKSGDGQIWILDLARGVRTRLAFGPWAFENPVWSGEGDRVMYVSQEKGSLDFYAKFADGSGEVEPIFADDKDKVLFDWSRDGEYLAYWPIGAGSGTPNIWIYSVERQQAEALITGEPTYADARFSPDTRWITYVSNDSGRMEVFVQAFGGDDGLKRGGRWQLSTTGGVQPHWRDDGREIVYTDLARRVTTVSVEVQGDRLLLGKPRELFPIEDRVVTMDATPDHERFLVATRDEVGSEPLHVVLNWLGDLPDH